MTKWKTIKLIDVAYEVSERVDNPSTSGYDRFVGLEHFISGDFRISKWGTTENLISAMKLFKAGDTLFARRNAYLKRVSMADFDGICSGDAIVLRNNEKMIDGFLPLILNTDHFWEHAIANAAGSMSKRVRVEDLMKYEFPLPPVDEQRRIADLLWAADDVISQHQDLLEKISLLKKSAIHEYTTRSKSTKKLKDSDFGKIPETWNVEPLGTLLEKVQYGLSKPLVEKAKYPVFRMMNIIDGKMVANDMKYIDLPDEEFQIYKANKGDILFNRTNSADLVGKLGIFELDGDYVFASYLIRLVAKRDVILPEYLNYYLNSEEGQSRISAFATAGVSQTNINASNLQRVLVPVPPIEEQIEVVNQLSEIDLAKQEIIGHLENSKELKKQLLATQIG